MAMAVAKRVWLIRHGEAEHNKLAETVSRDAARRLPDPGLTALGKEQARQLPSDPLLREVLEGEATEALVVVSPMLRTLQTATEAFASSSLRMVANPDLQETNPVPCDCLRPVSVAAVEFPHIHFEEAGLPPLDEWHVKRYASTDGGMPIPLWPENPFPTDCAERQRIARALASRWATFSSWLAQRREERIIVVAHHNVFKIALDLCFNNCQVMEFVLEKDLQWSLVQGKEASPPQHWCPILKENIGPACPSVMALGTTNRGKVQAVQRGLCKYPALGLQMVGVKVDSGVSDQPTTLEETTQGAKNRAERAAARVANGCRLGMGLESGLFHLDGSFYDVCVCSVYDGKQHHLGFSCAWQLPLGMVELIQTGKDMSQACSAMGLCNDPSIGEKEGAIGILSGGRVTRQDYTEQAVLMALLACNPAWYKVAIPGTTASMFGAAQQRQARMLLIGAASAVFGAICIAWFRSRRLNQ